MPKAVSVARLELRGVGEELGVGRVGAGIAALDVVDAEIVEHGGDAPLVLDREVDARRLRAVAQRRVEQIESFFTHSLTCRCATASSMFVIGVYACARTGGSVVSQMRALGSHSMSSELRAATQSASRRWQILHAAKRRTSAEWPALGRAMIRERRSPSRHRASRPSQPADARSRSHVVTISPVSGSLASFKRDAHRRELVADAVASLKSLALRACEALRRSS